MAWSSSVLGLLLAATSAVASPAPIVNLPYASYQGIRNDTLGIDTYYGLPYAVPPTGELRWQRPVSIEDDARFLNSTRTIYNATVPGTECVQAIPQWEYELAILGSAATNATTIVSTTVTPVQSEDCLHLDVIVPTNPASSSLPVIVMIHGGGYVTGDSRSSDGSEFVSYANGSVIWVQIQYRLGVYGFLGSDEVIKDGVANAGLLDQREALEWVQRNIKAFGGDPNQVTIWGGSAGGGSVTSQMMLYGGSEQPPFRAAIAEYPWWQPLHGPDVLEAQYQQLLTASGCRNLACLRRLSADLLANATALVYELGYEAGTYGYGDYYFGPSVDGEIIRDLPSLEFARKHFSRVPLLVDHDGQEGWAFTNFSITAANEVLPDLQTLWPDAGPSFFDRLLQAYYPLSSFNASFFDHYFYIEAAETLPMLANNSAFYQIADIFGDVMIDCPTYYIASALSDAGIPVYKMRFAAGDEVHGATAPFLLEEASATVNATLADIMKSYFLSFAVELDPNPQRFPTSPFWPLYHNTTVGNFNVLQVVWDSIAVVQDADAAARCDFFRGEPYSIRN